jgi:thioredoxin 1
MSKHWILFAALLAVAGCGGNQASGGTALVEVNGEAITEKQVTEQLDTLPRQARVEYDEDPKAFVEQLVRRTILLQEARKRELDRSEAFKPKLKTSGKGSDELLIEMLGEEVTRDVSVNEEDLEGFVRENREQLPSSDLQALRPRLEPLILKEKRQAALDQFIEDQMARSKIVWNAAWVKAQEAARADNPLDRALSTGRPVLADFGRGICIPCKKMQPILEALGEEYKGKAEVLIIEIDEYRALTSRVKLRLIPTQIFYDGTGKEVYRHEGFMPREAIVAKLEEMGVD